jgi:DNA polymerase-3 subunit delta
MKAKPPQDIYPVYFLYGPEDYLIEDEIQKLLNQTLSLKERGLNFHLFSGEEHSAQEVVQAAQTLPMFSQYRFVLINEADRMDEEKVEALMEYIQKPSPSTCLVLSGQAIGPWKKHRKDIEKVGKVTEYTRLKGRALVSWMKNKMSEKGKSLSEESADYLVEIVGDHLYDVENALEKVFLSVGEKRSIELTDVEEVTSEVKLSTIYELTDAIGHQNLEKALGILERAIESNSISFKRDEDPQKKKDQKDVVPLILDMMAKRYSAMLLVKSLFSRYHGATELAEALNMQTWIVKRLIDQATHFSESSLREGILKCHQADLAIKRSRGPKDLLMEKLVIDLCRPVQLSSLSFQEVGDIRTRTR